jgi:alkanesulfonate monooxygenase SsuD/methylene tetrahydromethanopterin reductase-like flavin-dependent oxidoreductase (luciferase family)
LLRNTWLADTAAERRQALDWVRSSYLVYAGLGWGATDTGVDFASKVDASMDEVEATAIVGSAAEVSERLRSYDVDLIVCRIGYDQPPRPALTEVIARIGHEIVPELA